MMWNVKMKIIVECVNKVLATLIVLISGVMLACVVWQVLSRYVLGVPSVVTEEIARFLLMWLGLLGAGYVTGMKRHLAIDLLLTKIEGKNKLFVEILIHLFVILFAAAVMVYGGYDLMQKTLASNQVSPSLGVKMGLIYAAIPVSGLFILFYSLVAFGETLCGKDTNPSNNSETTS